MAPPQIIIVGAGFGGLAAAKALKDTPAEIIVIDRTNYHLFQPLLYQVATAVLTPSQIATPICSILRNQKSVTVILGEVTGVDKSNVSRDWASRSGWDTASIRSMQTVLWWQVSALLAKR
jgi:NADH dehydrogenase FAD-containing subunit